MSFVDRTSRVTNRTIQDGEVLVNGARTTADAPPELEHPWDETERAVLVALLRTRPNGMTWQEIAAEVSSHGSATTVWNDLVQGDLFDQQAREIEQAAADIRSWRDRELGFSTFLDQDYPARLREIHEMPPVLFHRGSAVPDEHAVSVVGSRSASERGTAVAATIAENLVQRGITVLSGLAKGIDTAAHTAALNAGGRTVACIGTGIDECYPAENRALHERIMRDGMVFSQFWPGTPPRQQNFPMRNAVMSGYGTITVIVEAGEKSGARIQARQSVGHGRPVILTDWVVSATDWAKKLRDLPGVHVASSTREVMDVIEQYAVNTPDSDDLLEHLVALRRGPGS